MRRPRLAADLLAVDVGNTKLEAVLYRDGCAAARWRVEPENVRTRSLVSAWHAMLHVAPRVPIVLACVAADRKPLLAAGLGGRRAHWADWRSPWPFRIAVRTPQTLGADRLANVCGLHALGLRNAIAIDCGTAITVDVLQEGVFRGGAILPGFDLALRALAEGTAALPRVRLRTPVPPLGTDTPSAMRAGVFQVTRAGIAGLVRHLRRTTGIAFPVIVSGGAGELLGDLGTRAVHHEPDLQFLGLRSLAVRIQSR